MSRLVSLRRHIHVEDDRKWHSKTGETIRTHLPYIADTNFTLKTATESTALMENWPEREQKETKARNETSMAQVGCVLLAVYESTRTGTCRGVAPNSN